MKLVHPAAAVATDAALGFQPFEQLIHGALLGGATLGIEDFGQAAHGRGALVPEDL
jgi:hypothetical protein